MQFLYSGSDVEANKANALFVLSNPTWFHLVVSIHAISALSLCVFTVLGYVASTIPMTLVVLFIFQTFMAILGLTAIEQSRRDYRSLYVAVNTVTAGSAIIWFNQRNFNFHFQPQDQQKDSSVMKTGASVTESVQQQQNISETRNEEFPKRTRIAAGAERDGVKEDIKAVVQLEETSNETKNSAVSSYVNHPSEGHCFVIGSNWREFYAIPILNTCNVPLCSTGRTGRDRFRNRLLIKKCRNK
uniref:Uncharacterized protein n=1 Tax=Wuchereria bancrofti TaxID=6293 RepID=A0AAF5PQ94_WUCBA